MFGGETTSFLEIVIPAWLEKWKPSSLNASSASATAGGAVGLDQLGDDLVDVALLQRAVDELVALRVPLLLERVRDRPLDPVVEDDPADGGQEVLVAGAPVLGVVVELDEPFS